MRTMMISLDPHTAAWLDRESAAANHTPAEFIAELLHELADPDHVEGDLIDRLLAEATHHFPPIMTLEEQTEMREEVLDDLCRRIVEGYQRHVGVPLCADDEAALKRRLLERSQHVWSSQ